MINGESVGERPDSPCGWNQIKMLQRAENYNKRSGGGGKCRGPTREIVAAQIERKHGHILVH